VLPWAWQEIGFLFLEAIGLLAWDKPPHRYFDHPLPGDWSSFLGGRIRPDLMLWS
jgi:mRNA-degrading endonuclease YafQ of YafQ-DinJ toxin-antitoxin module